MEAEIFDIQRFSLNDGPGIRTNIFFTGCPLHCPWCSNPESQKRGRKILHKMNKCVHCGRCAAVCPQQKIRVTADEYVLDQEGCLETCPHFGVCAETCLTDALSISGKTMTTEEIIKIVQADRVYYEESNGGATFSGGDPLMQVEALRELSKMIKEADITTALETEANVSEDVFARGIEYMDYLLLDLKSADAEKLQNVTGGNLELIQTNIRRAVKSGKDVLIRVPVIPGFNEDEKSMEAIFLLALKMGAAKADVLPYHLMGRKKYEELGLPYPYETYPNALSKEDLIKYRDMGERMGIHTTISGKTSLKERK